MLTSRGVLGQTWTLTHVPESQILFFLTCKQAGTLAHKGRPEPRSDQGKDSKWKIVKHYRAQAWPEGKWGVSRAGRTAAEAGEGSLKTSREHGLLCRVQNHTQPQRRLTGIACGSASLSLSLLILEPRQKHSSPEHPILVARRLSFKRAESPDEPDDRILSSCSGMETVT